MTDLPGYDDYSYQSGDPGFSRAGRHVRRDVQADLEDLMLIVEQAKSVPLSNSVLLSRDEMLTLLENVRANLPQELLEARQALRDREELLEMETRRARNIVESAQVEAARMVESTQIVRESKLRAERIVSDAQNRARTIIHEAEFYIDNKLGQFEIALDRLLRQVQQVRERFTEQMAPTSLVGSEANPHVLPRDDEEYYADEPMSYGGSTGIVFDQDAE